MKNQTEVEFFASEKAAGTLAGAITNNPAAAARALGPLAVIAEMSNLSPEDEKLAEEYLRSIQPE